MCLERKFTDKEIERGIKEKYCLYCGEKRFKGLRRWVEHSFYFDKKGKFKWSSASRHKDFFAVRCAHCSREVDMRVWKKWF